ncbi:unnamed protein product, partial [Closterium sp. NIES-65]
MLYRIPCVCISADRCGDDRAAACRDCDSDRAASASPVALRAPVTRVASAGPPGDARS